MTIPHALLNQLQKKQVVLFLGAGASIGAAHPERKRSPIGSELAELLDAEFLGGSFKGVSLEKIAELAISETNL